MTKNLKMNHEPGPSGIFPKEQSLAVCIRDVVRLLSRVLEPEITQFGVTITQYYYLRILWDEDGLSQQELAKRVGTKPPSTVVTLRGMEAAGLIYRQKNSLDRRVSNTFLTDKGKLLKKKLLPIAAKLNDEVLSGLTGDDRDVLWTLLVRLKEDLRAMAKD